MNLPLALLDGPVIWVVLFVVLLLFGGSKLPELARGLGKAKREFKKASDEVEDEVRSAVYEEDERKRGLRLKQVEEEERAAVRAKLEAEERAKRAQDGKQN